MTVNLAKSPTSTHRVCLQKGDHHCTAWPLSRRCDAPHREVMADLRRLLMPMNS